MHEAALRAMKQSLTASFRHFFLLFKNALMGLPSFHSGDPAFLQKKMAEREGFEPSTIRLMKLHLKEGFIQYFERNFLKF